MKNIWKLLRQDFRKRLSKIDEQSGNLATESEKVTWPYFKKLLFLQDQFGPRPPASNVHYQPIESNDGNSTDCQLLWTGGHTVQTFDFPTNPLSDSESSCPPYSTSKKRRLIPEAEVEIQLIQLEKEKLALQREIHGKDPNDEDIGFLNSLLPHVKNLSPKDKLIFRMKVQQVLFEMVYGHQSTPNDTIFFRGPINEKDASFNTEWSS